MTLTTNDITLLVTALTLAQEDFQRYAGDPGRVRHDPDTARLFAGYAERIENIRILLVLAKDVRLDMGEFEPMKGQSVMSKRKPHTYPIGTVSSGTMVDSDLIETFLWELRKSKLSRANRNKVRAIQKEYNAATLKDGLDLSDADWGDCVNELMDIMDTLAGPFMYFGAHQGDGADYGYWLQDDWQTQLTDEAGLIVSDLSAPQLKGHNGYVAVISDHGNATLYWQYRGRLTELWSIV